MRLIPSGRSYNRAGARAAIMASDLAISKPALTTAETAEFAL
jgi:hypothetical protein